MIFNKLIIHNFKQFEYLQIELNQDINMIVGENETGKTTILEALALVTTGKFWGRKFEAFLSNELFNYNAANRYLSSLSSEKPISPPEILIEVYAEDEDSCADMKGMNNSLMENSPGIAYKIYFNPELTESYQEALKQSNIKDMPLEFYRYEWKSFAGEVITSYNNPITASIIDTSQVNNNIIGTYISQEIKENLSDSDIRSLATTYRSLRNDFSSLEPIQKLNSQLADRTTFTSRLVEVSLNSINTLEWQKDLSLKIDSISFQYSGRGAQNILKTSLALAKRPQRKTSILLIEEPENNLSYTNMAKLVSEIIDKNKDRQIFIATHSSFIVNKLGLDKIILLYNKTQTSLKNLPHDTIEYFKKLPGYDTLRLALAEKVILVEGPTDELIIQAAYLKAYNHLPIADGIDIISVRSLAFKRFCDMAMLLKKPVVVVTDNDGDIQCNINEKYKDYDKSIVILVYEKDQSLNTIEPSFLNANADKIVELGKLITGKEKSYDNLLSYMTKNKTEWALKVFDNPKSVNYPEYINDAIKYTKE